ncbi:MAG: TetR/AcrR family transcriptional regulator [Clostridia bacterium]|nr:TetR/AcrR family transcriptional regulator [Clostridia bacterium]
MAKEAKEKRVENIVNAAVEIFLVKGYEGASMEAIAQRAGMSKGGLYHHFKSKDEILYYANERLSEPVYGFIQKAVTSGSGVEGLKGYIEDYVRYWYTHQTEIAFFFLSMTKALATQAFWPFYEEYYNQLVGFIEALYQKAIEQGELKEHDARLSGIMLMSALDGILGYLVMNSKAKLESIIEDLKRQFIEPLKVDRL